MYEYVTDRWTGKLSYKVHDGQNMYTHHNTMHPVTWVKTKMSSKYTNTHLNIISYLLFILFFISYKSVFVYIRQFKQNKSERILMSYIY